MASLAEIEKPKPKVLATTNNSTTSQVKSIPNSEMVVKKLSSKNVSPQRNAQYTKKFSLPESEQLLKVYSCALFRQGILAHGRLYISKNYFCFYSNIFGIKTQEVIPISEIVEIKKTFRNLSLGILVTLNNSKQHNFASFFSRDKAFQLLTASMQNVQAKGQEAAVEVEEESELKDEEEEGEPEEEEEDDAGEHFLMSSNFREVATAEFPISITTFFKLFFATKDFAEEYHLHRGDSEITIKDWLTHSQFGNIRELQYKAPVKQGLHGLGRASARIEEIQRYQQTPNKLLIETISVMYDVVLGDNFRLEGQWEVVPGKDPNSCKLTILFGIHFLKKSSWFKGKIESASKKETTHSFEQWVQLAQKKIEDNGLGEVVPPPPVEDNISPTVEETPHGGTMDSLCSAAWNALDNNTTPHLAMLVFATVSIIFYLFNLPALLFSAILSALVTLIAMATYLELKVFGLERKLEVLQSKLK